MSAIFAAQIRSWAACRSRRKEVPCKTRCAIGAFVGLNTLNGQPFRSRIYDVDPDAVGMFANTDPTKAPDGVAGLNVHSMPLPLAELAPEGQEDDFLAAVDAGVPSNETLFGV